MLITVMMVIPATTLTALRGTGGLASSSYHLLYDDARCSSICTPGYPGSQNCTGGSRGAGGTTSVGRRRRSSPYSRLPISASDAIVGVDVGFNNGSFRATGNDRYRLARRCA
ncbi:hypothetical protein BGW80DRAFT_164637 [Lactifluus volemus]|nr:hypothetical protein BGW80DRAFT_164637 [Lactifluus volemus]